MSTLREVEASKFPINSSCRLIPNHRSILRSFVPAEVYADVSRPAIAHFGYSSIPSLVESFTVYPILLLVTYSQVGLAVIHTITVFMVHYLSIERFQSEYISMHADSDIPSPFESVVTISVVCMVSGPLVGAPRYFHDTVIILSIHDGILLLGASYFSAFLSINREHASGVRWPCLRTRALPALFSIPTLSASANRTEVKAARMSVFMKNGLFANLIARSGNLCPMQAHVPTSNRVCGRAALGIL